MLIITRNYCDLGVEMTFLENINGNCVAHEIMIA